MTESVREITLNDIARAVIRHRRVVSICVACTFIVALLYGIFATPVYSASVVVQPQTSQSGGGTLAALAGKLGSLSSLTGLDLNHATADENNYLATLKSRALALKFIDQYNIAPLLFPGRWDAQAQRWKPLHLGVVGRVVLFLRREVAQLSHDRGWHPPGDAPTTWQTLEAFRRIVTVKDTGESGVSGVVTVTFKSPDPQLAKGWADEYVALANSLIRARVISQTQLALDDLSQEAEQTNLTELKDATYALMERHLEELIDAKSKPDYAFQVVDPAVLPGTPTSPKRSLILIGAILLGLMTGSLYAFFRDFFIEPHRSHVAPLPSGSDRDYVRSVGQRL